MKKQSILTALCLLAILVSVSTVSAADTYVDGSVVASGDGSSWEQAYKTIKDGYNGVTAGNTIYIAAGTYTGTDNKDIDLAKDDIIIQGAGAGQTIIDCENSGGAFTVKGKTVTIKDLTIKNGKDTTNDPFSGSDSAINNDWGTLTVIGCTFESNDAPLGGAISSLGTLTVNDCTFNSNTGSNGGAIYTRVGTCTVTGSTFTGNTASSGGAIWNGDTSQTPISTLIVNDCTFTGNTASNDGGAIWNGGKLIITGSNFYDNTATGHGGAITGFSGTIEYLGQFGFIKIPYESDTTVKYSRFVRNTASNNLNDIHLQYTDLEVQANILNAQLNWWGSNSGPAGKITGDSNIPIVHDMYTPWLLLNINADPLTIYTGQTSKITADVYRDSSDVDHSGDADQFFSGPQVTFTTDLGNVGSKTITVDWDHGKAIANLLADEGAGVATVTAADVQTVLTSVTILQTIVTSSDPVTTSGNEVNTANSVSGTVGMQETGTPIAGLILAVLMFVGGFVTFKKNSTSCTLPLF